MQEFMLARKPAVTNGPGPNDLLYIDFTTGSLGAQTAYDQVTKTFLSHRSFATTNPTDGYVDHPTFGRCYYFNGACAFVMGNTIALNSINYLLTVEVATYDATTYMITYDSGDWPSSPSAGTNFNLNNTTGAYWGAFSVTGAGASREASLNGTNDLGMNKLTARKDASGFTLGNTTKGTTVTTSYFNTNGDSWGRIGSNSAAAACFKGWMKSLVITKLP